MPRTAADFSHVSIDARTGRMYMHASKRFATKQEVYEYEAAGWENSHSDNNHEGSFETCEECQRNLGPAPRTFAKTDRKVLVNSSVESPVVQVWETCFEMAGAPRKDVVAACVAKGIALNTAKTQFQRWFAASK